MDYNYFLNFHLNFKEGNLGSWKQSLVSDFQITLRFNRSSASQTELLAERFITIILYKHDFEISALKVKMTDLKTDCSPGPPEDYTLENWALK